jgi:hypothetical protein
MSVCKWCGQEQMEHVGCTIEVYGDFIDGLMRPRIRFGDEVHEGLHQQFNSSPEQRRNVAGIWTGDENAGWAHVLAALRPGGTHGLMECHDCGVKVGDFHHPGCDDEECPRCEGQAMACECVVATGKGSRNIATGEGRSRDQAMQAIGGQGEFPTQEDAQVEHVGALMSDGLVERIGAEKIEKAVELGTDAFWVTFAGEFPEATTGDFDPLASFALDEALRRAGIAWLLFNHPAAKDEEATDG